jgi:hypothetical protein
VNLTFLPEPKSVRLAGGHFLLPVRGAVAISDWRLAAPADFIRWARPRYGVVQLAAGQDDPIVLRMAEGHRPGGYRLDVTPRGAILSAGDVEGAWNAARTLDQLSAQCPDGVLPCLSIRDWPDYAVRGVYYDVARGRVPTLPSLLQLSDRLAQFKINHLQLYVEHTFRFRKHPDIGRDADPLTAADILALDAACAERAVDFVPSLASFGHMDKILRLPRYRGLAEDWGVGRYTDPAAEDRPAWQRRVGWTLSPANPRVYRFLAELYAEFLPLFRSGAFNVCCDETWDLGLGQTRDLCRARGKGRVYMDHILRLRDLAAAHGKRVQFWGDIILHYPELVPELPRDVTVLDWGYNHDVDVSKLVHFERAGLPFHVCPGTSGWVTWFPRLPESRANIRRYAEAGLRHGAVGLLNTDWGDGGHQNFNECAWYGYLFGAEQAWNARADRDTFTRRFLRHFLRSESRVLADALEALGRLSHLSLHGLYQSVWLHAFFGLPGDRVFANGRPMASIFEAGEVRQRPIQWGAALARRTLDELEGVAGAFAAAGRERGADPAGVLPYWRFAADATAHAARRLAAFGPDGRDTPAIRRALRREMLGLTERFRDLWMRRNRRSEIHVTFDRCRRALGSGASPTQ